MLRYTDEGYRKLLREFAEYTNKGEKLDGKVWEILQSCHTDDEAATRKILGESPFSLKMLTIKLSRLGNEIPVFDLEKQMLEFFYNTPEVGADGFPEAAKYDLLPRKVKPTQNWAEPPTRPAPVASEAPELVVDKDLERKVRKTMNSIYLTAETEIDWEIFKGDQKQLVQKSARDYLAKLLMGAYDTLDGSLRKVGKSHQRAVYDGLRAYLPFRNKDIHFLANTFIAEKKEESPNWKRNHPDWPIAEALITRIEGTKGEEGYTNIQMARIPFMVLLGENNLRRMRGYNEHKRIIESVKPADFKDSTTLDYINKVLKSEVVNAARRLYDVPIREDD